MTYRGKLRKQCMVVLATFGAVLATAATPAQAAVSETSDAVPGFNGTVLAVAYSGSTIYVGGDFTSAIVKGKSYARSRLAAVNAYTGELLPWAPTADGRVKAIAVSGSSVYVGGDFGYVSGQKRDSLARLDATSGAVSSTFKHAIEGKPYALAAANGRLYVGGTLTKVNGQVRTRLAAFDLSTGVLDAAWKPTADDQVEALATASGRVYVGGKFHKVNSTSGYDRLVALDPASAAIVTGFKPKPAVIVFAIAVTSDSVYTAHGGQGGTAAAYTLTGTKRWSATFDGDAQAITTLGDTVYVGGHFDHACRTARTGDQGVCLDGSDDRIKLAALALDDGHLRDWTANMNGIEGVLTMAASTTVGAFAAGGAFTTVDGVSQKRFAQFS
ncbi:hypothetical protein [Actinoplanes sp. NPDC049681]|uniref:hypothetical protein n=1 Tax=Actinoplanes sp. NPDC049681 TaxID=3363905 RepID=UPI00379AE8D6